MLEPEEGEVCDAFVPFHLKESSVLSKLVGPPLGEGNDKE
jgi:hypothetical protein